MTSQSLAAPDSPGNSSDLEPGTPVHGVSGRSTPVDSNTGSGSGPSVNWTQAEDELLWNAV